MDDELNERMHQITNLKNEVYSMDYQLNQKIQKINSRMNQFNNIEKEMDEQYDTLCAKEKHILSVIENFFNLMEDQTLCLTQELKGHKRVTVVLFRRLIHQSSRLQNLQNLYLRSFIVK